MGFWDDPTHQPPAGAWPAEGVITRMQVMQSSYGRLALCVELDNDGRQRWCPTRMWRAFADARADVGDRVSVSRGPDMPPRIPGGEPVRSWQVEKTAPPGRTGSPTWPAPSGAGPTW